LTASATARARTPTTKYACTKIRPRYEELPSAPHAKGDDDRGAWISTWLSAVERAINIAVNVLVFTPAEWEAAEHNNERIITEIRRDAVMLSGSIS